jgi:hypothetical protein
MKQQTRDRSIEKKIISDHMRELQKKSAKATRKKYGKEFYSEMIKKRWAKSGKAKTRKTE